MTYAVMGLDLSLTSTGLADFDGDVFRLQPGKRKGMERLEWIKQEILTRVQCGVHRGAHLVTAIEGYSLNSKFSHAHALGELGGVVRHTLWRHDHDYVDVPPATLKAYATGKGNAGKEELLVAAVKRLGYEGSSNDEADALWLRAAVLDALGQPVVEVPKEHRKFLDRLDLSTIRAETPA